MGNHVFLMSTEYSFLRVHVLISGLHLVNMLINEIFGPDRVSQYARSFIFFNSILRFHSLTCWLNMNSLLGHVKTLLLRLNQNSFLVPIMENKKL